MKPTLNVWSLFWVLALATSTANLLGLSDANFHSARGMSPIILRSVRCALPLFLVAFTASSLATLWPSAGTRWLLANRRYIGLAFAFAMAWHFSFVVYTIWSFGNPLNAKATALDLIGFVFLLLLTLTSFRSAARRLSRANWRRLHKTGVYVIWLVATAIYFHSVRDGGDLLHRVVFAALLAAWMLRIAAWARKRSSRTQAAARTSAIQQP
jgi:DMSO/TMAO reductase YedYZ heme-binding membrane subunit